MVDQRPGHRHAAQPMPGRARIAWIVLAGIAAFYLWAEHRAHLLGVLPFLLLLGCPLMHLFMHGHGHGGEEMKGGGK